MRRDDRHRGARAGTERRAAVEAEPADPQQAGADHGHRQIVRRKIFRAVAAPLAEHQRRDEPRHAGIDVDHRAASEIEHAHGLQKSPAPDPMRERHIDDEQPQDREQHECRKTHAIRDCARDECDRDDREGHLVDHEQALGDGFGERAHAIHPDAVQQRAL